LSEAVLLNVAVIMGGVQRGTRPLACLESLEQSRSIPRVRASIHRVRAATLLARSPRLAGVMVAIAVARLPELVPLIGKLRPGFIGTAVVALVLLMRSNAATWRLLWQPTTTRVLLAFVAWRRC